MAEINTHPTSKDILLDLLQNHITSSIIPQMEKRRGRNEPLTPNEIEEKLNRYPASGKPGEEHELTEQIRRNIDGVDGEFASEIADIFYYLLQPNCPPQKSESAKTLIVGILGIPLEAAYEFCIVKYEARIKYGDMQNYKEIENILLDNFIEKLYPELKTIWQATPLITSNQDSNSSI